MQLKLFWWTKLPLCTKWASPWCSLIPRTFSNKWGYHGCGVLPCRELLLSISVWASDNLISNASSLWLLAVGQTRQENSKPVLQAVCFCMSSCMHCMDTQQIVTVARYQHGCVSVNYCSTTERQCCPCSLCPRSLPQLLFLTLTVVVEDWEQGYICSKSLRTQYDILLVYRKACSVAQYKKECC